MKHLIPIFTYTFSLPLLAAVPLSWTVETSRAQPATFEAYQGETLTFEAHLQANGKPLEAPLNYSFFWQTNGMGSTYWETPCAVPPPLSYPPSEASSEGGAMRGAAGAGINVLFATWLPSMDVGSRVYNCFIGSPSNNYHAAFQLRLRPSPGATPNAIPLPTPVIDFAKVTVLNPPWGSGGGVDTNAVRDIVRETVSGDARPLPRYLHALDFADSYTNDAAWYYSQRGGAVPAAQCSAVRSGGFLYRNFDYPFDDRAEFIVRMAAGPDRFASVGVAQVGTNLTEQFVVSGKPSRWYKALPGATVDGINEHGVVAEINVVDGDPGWGGGVSPALHPLAAVRWVLDHATNAQHAADYLASHIAFPAGWMQNFHYMIADETSTYIVEDGTNYLVGAGASRPRAVMTNFRLYPTRDTTGAGQERYDLLADGENITNAWYTLAYSRDTNPPWYSEFESFSYEDMNRMYFAWESFPRESHRGERFGSLTWWQTVHTSVYDITNRVLRVAVQEIDDWYTFQVPVTGGSGGGGVTVETDPTVPSWAKQPAPPVTPSSENEGWALNADWANGSSHAEIADWAENSVNAQVADWSDNANKALDVDPNAPGLQPIAADAAEAKTRANDANVWAEATYNFMVGGRTNCWFSGTNYVFGADAATRHRFAWEDGMDALTVPCSMALWEIRDGARECVWDQRDWVSWYWSFKAAQMEATIQGRIDALGNSVTNDANYAWAKRYASDGTPNPDSSTTFIDTPSVTLSPGMRWETVATVSGAAYWTIVGNGAVIGGSGTNATLQIKDFEGNDIMTVTKGEHRLAWLEHGEIYAGGMSDEDGWVCFDMLADVQPVGYFSTTLVDADFISESDPDCPAQCRWEDLGSGKWRVHFLLKPGIQSSACFAEFQVEIEGETIIRYNAGQEISGGLIYNGVKIAPDISGSPAVGTVIQWKVVR